MAECTFSVITLCSVAEFGCKMYLYAAVASDYYYEAHKEF